MIIESTQHGRVPLRIASPGARPSRAVIVWRQASGCSTHTQEWLVRFADHGYLAVAPMLLHAHGLEMVDPEQFSDDVGAFTRFLPGDPALLADIDTAVDFVAASGAEVEQTGLVGFAWWPRGLPAGRRAGAGGVGHLLRQRNPARELHRQRPTARSGRAGANAVVRGWDSTATTTSCSQRASSTNGNKSCAGRRFERSWSATPTPGTPST